MEMTAFPQCLLLLCHHQTQVGKQTSISQMVFSLVKAKEGKDEDLVLRQRTKVEK